MIPQPSIVKLREMRPKVLLLAENKQFIPELAQLWIDEVGQDDDPCPDIENVQSRFMQHCNKDKLPIAYVGIYQNKPIGMVCLRTSEGIQNDLSPWLGGLVVHPNYRGRKIGEELISAIKEHAKVLGYTKLYLLCDGILSIWYEKLGWQKIGYADNDLDIIIMSSNLVNCK